ncbi:hypothetical protein W822_12120 [Advenella kashmirensis W13003]|uniref:Uncharacterized protein n=1 Tax=Advenella kashmirensis W13003 TaxID=1424334 RepID=V8QSN2_9BURK|nr:hypothetical protein W822_12120 [Advenella kashmirensis W13003]
MYTCGVLRPHITKVLPLMRFAEPVRPLGDRVGGLYL